MEPPPSDTRRSIWPLVKGAIFVLVLVFVARSAIQLWNAAPPESVQIEWGWLFPAAVFYLIGWMPSYWLWRSLLLGLHQPSDWWSVFRAYFVGHIGKYSPGKAMVPIIRAGLLKADGVSSVMAFVAVAYETLVFMASGTILGLAVAPFALSESQWQKVPASFSTIRDNRLMFSLAVVLGGLASIPIISWLFTRIGRKLIARRATVSTQLPTISVSLIGVGMVVCAVGWVCHALSLGFVISASVHSGFGLNQLPLWITASTASTVGGFIAIFAPGGIGVREGLLIELLKDQPGIGPAFAILIACLLRSVWFLVELTLTGVLYIAGDRKPETLGVHDKDGGNRNIHALYADRNRGPIG